MSIKDKICSWAERYLPIVLCVFFAVVYIVLSQWIHFDFKDAAYDKILDATINFTSIIIGFIGVLIGIIFSIRDSGIVNYLLSKNGDKKLKRYFLSAIAAGIALIVISTILYLRNEIFIDSVLRIFIAIWCGCMVYSIACYWRIISIMIQIIFLKDKKPINYDFSNSKASQIKEKFMNRRD